MFETEDLLIPGMAVNLLTRGANIKVFIINSLIEFYRARRLHKLDITSTYLEFATHPGQSSSDRWWACRLAVHNKTTGHALQLWANQQKLKLKSNCCVFFPSRDYIYTVKINVIWQYRNNIPVKGYRPIGYSIFLLIPWRVKVQTKYWIISCSW